MPSSYGVQFQRSADSGSTYTKVAGLKAIEAGAIVRAAFETHGIDGEVGDDDYGFKTFEGEVLKDPGEITLTLISGADASHDTLLGDMDLADPQFYRVAYPSINKQVTFKAIVTEIGDPSTDAANQTTFTVKLKRSGEITKSDIA